MLSIYTLGTRASNPNLTNNQIIIANIATYSFGLLAFPFAILSLVFAPDALLHSITFPILAVFCLTLTYNGYFRISRWFISLGFPILFQIYAAMLNVDNEPMAKSLLILYMTMSIGPWLIFSIKDYQYLILAIGWFILLYFTFEYTDDLFSLANNPAIQNQDWFLNTSFVVFVVGIGSLLYANSWLIKSNQSASDDVMKQISLKNELMSKNESELTKNIEQIRENQILEANRNWAAEGIAKTNIIFRTQTDNLDQLYEQFVSFIVNYTGANQAALFLKDNQMLDLKACYAYGKKKQINKQIQIGQGLVGQTFLEKQTFVLTKVPSDYIQITSGLGQATPSFLVLVPIIHEQEAFGVLEMAAFKPLEANKIAFLESVCQNMAAYVQVFSGRQNTALLLEELQSKTDTMQAQESDLYHKIRELDEAQGVISQKSIEIEEINKKEKENRTLQLDSQKKMMEQFVLKSKTTEKQLKEKIATLELVVKEFEAK